MLTRLIVGFALTAAVASVNCGGDDTTTPPGGGGGSGGTAGTGGGTGGTGTDGASGTATGGSGGTGGTGGSGGAGGMRDSGPDVSTDARADVADAPAATFAAVKAIFADRCVGCHNGTAARIDLSDHGDAGVDDAGITLYQRLTSPLPAAPAGFEGTCGGFGVVEGGADAGDGAAEAGDGAVATRIPIVPSNTADSFLYSKVLGTQPPGAPPAGCGLRMPRVGASPDGGPDGAAIASVGCDTFDGGAAVNCLTQAQTDTIRDWILAGAPNN
jgi:hypothetical protein